MSSRTQIVCLHEGKRGHSIDPIFIHSLIKALNPAWIRPWKGSNIVRTRDCGGRTTLIDTMPGELKSCVSMGGDTTLMVWADLDHDMADGEKLKAEFWKAAKAGIARSQFDQVVFVFAKDRIENWVEFLLTGSTDESKEGPRQNNGRVVSDAAKALADKCRSGTPVPDAPASLVWSCKNWKSLVEKMRK